MNSKFKDAARIWKNKYDRANQAKNDEIQKGTKLAEEISTLRQGNAIQDDHSLRDDSPLSDTLSVIGVIGYWNASQLEYTRISQDFHSTTKILCTYQI